MSFDIANLVINLGQVKSSFDWGNFFTALFGAMFGAWGAYLFNIKQQENQQKETEKAKLLKLFYDINILIKIFVYHHDNIVAEIGNQTGEEIQSITPITIKDSNFNIDEYGFLTQYSPVLYEILTYVHHDINYIYEQQEQLEKLITKKIKLSTYINKLEHIKVSTVKLLAKLFVSSLNINNFLIKNNRCKNSIKDEIVNSYIRAKKIIDRTVGDYSETLKDPQIQQEYDEEEIKTVKEDLKYINEIINTWIIDFNLEDKEKKNVEQEIREQVQKRLEAENDL